MSDMDRRSGHYRFPGLVRFIRYRGPFLAFLMLPPAVVWAGVLITTAIQGEPVAEAAVVGLCVLLGVFFVLALLLGFLEALDVWTSPYVERRRLELEQRRRDLARDPFHDEQRCRVSATEEVWVRHLKMTYSEN